MTVKRFVVLLFCTLVLGFVIDQAFVAPEIVAPSPVLNQDIKDIKDIKVLRPYADYEPVHYVVLESSSEYQSQYAKATIATHMPKEIHPIIFVAPAEDPALVKKYYEKLFARTVTVIDYQSGFWVRDILPIPVLIGDEDKNSLGLVTTTSWGSEPILPLAEFLSAQPIKSDNRFDGGNFTADALGHCVVINNNWLPWIQTETFSKYLGCKSVLRLPFLEGIGHIDERVKFIADRKVMTDEEAYVPILEDQGFEVVRLPRPKMKFATYVNALIVNKTVFMPVMQLDSDAKAIQIYKDQGFEVVPVDTGHISSTAFGSVHCFSIAYPRNPKFNFLQLLAQRVMSRIQPKIQ